MKLAWLLWLASILPGNAQEQTCLATTIYLEARDQPALGQMAVAEVVMRRRETGRWGKSACNVVMGRKQFAPAFMSPNTPIKNPKAWDRAWNIAGQTLTMWAQPAVKRKQVVPGTSALFLLSQSGAPDRLIEEVKAAGLSPQLIESNLSREQEERLREAFGE